MTCTLTPVVSACKAGCILSFFGRLLSRTTVGACSTNQTLGLNVDPARASPAEYVEQLATCGIDASVSNLSPHGVLVHSRPRDVGILPGISEGVVAVQDPAQQWALGSLSALPARARILDSCAAPGGKTRAVLHHQPSANVISLERSPSKVAKLRKRFEADLRVEVLEGDARKPAEWWNGVRFGAILLDAPCSATGIMRTRPEVKVHQTPASVNSLRATQFEMLRSLWPLLRDGGELLYTTCSLLSAENEDVIAKFVKQEKEAKMVKITPPLATDGKEYLSRKHGVLFLPSRWHQGGFSALLRKTCKQEPPTPPPIEQQSTASSPSQNSVGKRRRVYDSVSSPVTTRRRRVRVSTCGQRK